MRRYHVHGMAEEFECGWCGAPVSNGEDAYETDGQDRAYCSRACYGRGEPDEVAVTARCGVLLRRRTARKGA